ncbi:MAG: hypothetical protein V4858_04075 [Pseudomonadota bacterium]
MYRSAAVSLVCVLSLISSLSHATPASAYVGQENREIKALAPEDVKAYLAGKGIGLARAAELNGYAGPAHVLELGQQLMLTAEQTARTEAVFASMERKAISLGMALVDAERGLDKLFATKAITPALLTRALEEIGALQAQVRGVHLAAHLEQVAILTPEQNLRYAQLRGYSGKKASQGTVDHHVH